MITMKLRAQFWFCSVQLNYLSFVFLLCLCGNNNRISGNINHILSQLLTFLTGYFLV